MIFCHCAVVICFIPLLLLFHLLQNNPVHSYAFIGGQIKNCVMHISDRCTFGEEICQNILSGAVHYLHLSFLDFVCYKKLSNVQVT